MVSDLKVLILICNLEQLCHPHGGSLFTLYQWPSLSQISNLHLVCDKMGVFLLVNAKLISSNHQPVGTVTDSTCPDKLSESLRVSLAFLGFRPVKQIVIG